jgi:hypothetical protein
LYVAPRRASAARSFAAGLKADGFSVQQTNLLPTAGYGLQIGASFIVRSHALVHRPLLSVAQYSAVSDKIQMRWPVIAFAGMIAMIGSIVLATWPAGFSVKCASACFGLMSELALTGWHSHGVHVQLQRRLSGRSAALVGERAHVRERRGPSHHDRLPADVELRLQRLGAEPRFPSVKGAELPRRLSCHGSFLCVLDDSFGSC